MWNINVTTENKNKNVSKPQNRQRIHIKNIIKMFITLLSTLGKR